MNVKNEMAKILTDQQADELLVTYTAGEMTAKLRRKRNDGKGGWHGPSCTNKALKASLLEHIEKGDMIDVINLAAMIMVREQLHGKSA